MAQEYAALTIIEYLEESERMNTYRLHKRTLRDMANPFEIPEDRFIEIYRIDRELARFLINILRPHIKCGTTSRALSIETKVLTALNFYGQASYQKAVSQNINISMSQPSVSRCINDVSKAISAQLSNQWIKFPITRQEISSAQQSFFPRFNFPGVIGCIDGSHISIKGPADEETRLSYYNRKGFFSINCQIICGAEREILSINARFPGSVHDAAIWATSNVRVQLRRANISGVWMLGDSGYPLEPWLLTPFEHPDAGPQTRFNQHHTRTRNCVERCLGHLKGRFRCLSKQRELVYTHSMAINIIYSCAVLHNMCLSRNVPMPSSHEHEVENSEHTSHPELFNNLLALGRSVRDDVAHCPTLFLARYKCLMYVVCRVWKLFS